MSRKESERLQDILDAIAKIQDRVQSRQTFFEDELLQAFTLMNLQIIGEAGNRLPSSTKETNSHIPWKKIIGLRNLITHEYFRIDLTIVWDVVEQDLTPLKEDIEQLIRKNQ